MNSLENEGIFSLQGRDVWVFGGAGYLGRPLVELLARQGAKVLCADLEGRAGAYVQSLPAEVSRSVAAATCDVGNIPEATAFVEEQLENRGVPHGLVNLTFQASGQPLDELTAEDFDRANHLNLTAGFALTRQVAAQMAAKGRGSIILFSSMYGTVAPDPSIYTPPLAPNPIEYGANKAGVQQMARYFAVHYGSSGVRCNAVSPGSFPNPEVQRNHPELVRELCRKTPLGRIGQSPEIAGAVFFLLSDASSYVTGHNLAVDGGWTAW